MRQRLFTQQARLYWIGIVIGVAYGLVARWAFYNPALREFFTVMTCGFIFLIPTSLGYIMLRFVKEPRWWQRLVLPWIPGFILVLTAYAVGWESSLCIVMALPVFMIMGSAGGLLEAITRAKFSERNRFGALIAIVLLPYGVTPLEQLAGLPSQVRRVETQILIDAPVVTVWENIIRVPAIRPEELSFSWVHLIGIPRPVAALLSHEGVGGVRHATFAGGVTFVETIYEWTPQHALAFGTDAVAESMNADELNTRVIVGGAYFDTLEGRYWLEPVSDHELILHLTSEHRLSTRFNFYAGLWTDWIMRSTQNTILKVIKACCENADPL
ncbi:MAG: hypothetical protein R3C14_15735 [Caldilineaceae bacterium]